MPSDDLKSIPPPDHFNLKLDAAGALVIVDDQGNIIPAKAPERAVALGNVTGATEINTAVAGLYSMTVTGAIVITLSNPPVSGWIGSVTLEITAGDTGVTWPASVEWTNGTAPTLTAGLDTITLYTHDGGVTWAGFLSGSNRS